MVPRRWRKFGIKQIRDKGQPSPRRNDEAVSSSSERIEGLSVAHVCMGEGWRSYAVGGGEVVI